MVSNLRATTISLETNPHINSVVVWYYLSKGGAVLRALASHRCGLGSDLGVDAICWVEFVVGPLLCRNVLIGFSSGTPTDEEPLCGCVTSKSWLIYLFIYLFIIYLFITPKYDNYLQKHSNCLSLYYFLDNVYNVPKMQTNPRGSERVQHALAWKQGVVYWRESVRGTIPSACLGVPVQGLYKRGGILHQMWGA